MQGLFVLWLAEKLVKGLFNLPERGAQFIDDAAHGLAVADPAVQVFHPPFKRFGLPTGNHMFQPLGQALAADAHLGIRGVHVLIRRFQVQHGGGNLHGHRGGRWFARAHRDLNGAAQRAGQVAAFGVQLQNGVDHGIELVCDGFEPVGVATCQRRPGLGGTGDALSCLHQHGGVKPPKLRGVVVKRLGLIQPVGVAHCRQHRCIRRADRHRLGTKEQQVLRQSVRYGGVATRQRGVLEQHARGSPFCVDVCGTQAFACGFKKARANLPEHPLIQHRLPCSQRQADVPQGHGRRRIARFHDFENRVIEQRAHLGFIRSRCHIYRHGGVNPGPVNGPQVSRMDSLTTDQVHHITVLGKQRDGRRCFAFQDTFKVLGQRKTCALHLDGSVITAQLGALGELLRQRLHGAHHLGRRAESHHLQRSHGLVELLAGNAQLAGIQFSQIRAARQLGVAHETPDRLGRAVQRFFQLFQHPGQRPEIIACKLVVTRGGCVRLHGFVHSRECR